MLEILLAFAVIVVAYFKWSFSYWKRKKLPHLPPNSIFGNVENPVTRVKHIGISFKEAYEKMKAKGWKQGGLYVVTSPKYMPLDLDYLKNVLTKDFQYFYERGGYHNEKDDPLSAHLFAIGGKKWRNLRTKFTPTFTSGKMRMMFQTLVDCEGSLREVMLKYCEKKEPIDIKYVLGCFTTDIIGSCAFGLDCNTFKEQDSPFRRYGDKAFNSSAVRLTRNLFTTNFPNLARALSITQVSKDVSDFYRKIVADTVEYREKNNVTRKDFLQLLIEMKNNSSAEYNHDGNTLTLDEVAAQCFIFFLAGFETSSTTMTFALYELAKNQQLQDLARAEINGAVLKYNGKITYEFIMELKYMSQVIDETLRMYPPLSFITRVCVKDYKVPDENVIIDKGTEVIIPIMGIHYDPEYYKDPEVFDPERFSEENKKERHPYAHIPFGEGPRICIGMRFGLMQAKVGLTSMLRNYRFSVSNKMQKELKFSPTSFVLAAVGEVWLNAEKITE